MRKRAVTPMHDELVEQLAFLHIKAQESTVAAAELLELSPGDIFIPFNEKRMQPYCIRMITGDAKKSMVAYGIGLAKSGEPFILAANAHGSNWNTILTDRMSCWHKVEDGQFIFNPEVPRHPLSDAKAQCVIELLIRVLDAKRKKEFLHIKSHD